MRTILIVTEDSHYVIGAVKVPDDQTVKDFYEIVVGPAMEKIDYELDKLMEALEEMGYEQADVPEIIEI